MKLLPLILILLAPFLSSRFAQADESEKGPDKEPKMVSIFNGKDLTGWKVPEGNRWFTAADGVLKVKSGADRKGATLWTEKEYTDFVMDFEFKFGEGTVDSGIYIKKSSEQIQIGESGSLKRDLTGSPYISGKGYPFEGKNVDRLLKWKDWNAMKIEVRGKVYTVWINGEKVITYKSDSAVAKGPLGIQLHGNRDMAIDYRKIRLAETKA